MATNDAWKSMFRHRTDSVAQRGKGGGVKCGLRSGNLEQSEARNCADVSLDRTRFTQEKAKIAHNRLPSVGLRS